MENKVLIFLLLVLIYSKKAYCACESQQVTRINNYLNSFQNLRAKFIQTTYEDKENIGEFFMKRPTLMRLDYSRPNIELLYRDGEVDMYDRELETLQSQKIPDFILRAILEGNIQSKNLSCRSIYENEERIVVRSLAKYNRLGHLNLNITFKKNKNKLTLYSIENTRKGDYSKIVFDNLNYSNLPISIFEIH
jgi:outer membrane lipoprotein-sorting protein